MANPERAHGCDGGPAEALTTVAPAAPGAPRPLLVVHNPVAGRRRRRFLARVEAVLAAAGVATRIAATGARGDAERLVRAAVAAGEAAVAVAGGDGTINEAINGLAGSATALAVIPLGTANVFAGELDLPVTPGALAAAAAGSAVRAIHLGEISLGGGAARRFAIMAGVGFDAHVVANLSLGLKRATGKFAYAWQTLVEWLRLRPRRYRVIADGVALDCASAIVAKGHFYAGRFVAAPEASLGRASFELVLFEHGGRIAVLRYALALALGRLARARGVRILRARTIDIDGARGEPVHADGDIVGTLPARFAIAAARLTVRVP